MTDLPEWSVRCPWCSARPGTRCTSPRGRKLAIPSHDARLTAYAARTTTTAGRQTGEAGMKQKPTGRRHLRDSAAICPQHIDIPGEGPLRCELDAGHDDVHAHGCMRWGSSQSVTVQ